MPNEMAAQMDGLDDKFGWRPLLECRAVTLPPRTRNPLKLAGVPQTTGAISAASGPKFTILRGHLEEILLLNNFFRIVDMCLRWEDIANKVARWCPGG